MLSIVLTSVDILRSGTSIDRLRANAAPSGRGDAPSSERRWAPESRGAFGRGGRADPASQI
eukprot:7565724-Pyramimonas_sp.AAC.1